MGRVSKKCWESVERVRQERVLKGCVESVEIVRISCGNSVGRVWGECG